MIRFFIAHGGTVMQLPVNPEELEIVTPGANLKKEIVKLGQITILRTPKLAKIKISSFLPVDSNAPYVLTKGKFEEPNAYIQFFEGISRTTVPARLIVTDLDVNMEISIDSFKYHYEAGDDDTFYDLTVSEYRQRQVRVMQPISAVSEEIIKVSIKSSARPRSDYAIEDTVVVSGTYYSSSYGDGPTGSFTNYTGKISHIVTDLGRAYRYHITTPEGDYLGWVDKEQMSMT